MSSNIGFFHNFYFYFLPQGICCGGLSPWYPLPPAFSQGRLSLQEVVAGSPHWDQDRAADSHPDGLCRAASPQEFGGDH